MWTRYFYCLIKIIEPENQVGKQYCGRFFCVSTNPNKIIQLNKKGAVHGKLGAPVTSLGNDGNVQAVDDAVSCFQSICLHSTTPHYSLGIEKHDK